MILAFSLAGTSYSVLAKPLGNPVPVEEKSQESVHEIMGNVANDPVSVPKLTRGISISTLDEVYSGENTVYVTETEPNDYLYEADFVTNDLTSSTDYMLMGLIDYTYDGDLYRFTLNKTGDVTVVGAWMGDYQNLNWEDDLLMGIFDAYENVVATSFLVEDEVGATFQYLSVTLTPGTYYVAVIENSIYTDLYTGEMYAALLTFENQFVPVSGISVTPNQMTISGLGAMEQITANVMPSDATNKSVSWSSSNTSVATVDGFGNVISKGYGETTITAYSQDGWYQASCTVNVVPQRDFSGIYTIKSKNSGMVMDVFGGGTTEGTNIIQYSFHGMENQQWKFESLNNGYYKITSVLNPEYSIDVYGGGDTMGNRVIQYHYHGATNQQWKILENVDGSISLMSRLSEENGTRYLLDVYDGGKAEGVNVIQWAPNGGNNQKWFLQPVSSHTVTFNTNGGTEVMSVSGTERSLITEPAAPVKEGMVFAGWYQDEALTLRWNFASDRIPTTDLTLYAKWVKDYSGTYVIRSKNSNLVMDVYDGGTTEGTNIIQYSYHGGVNQQWKFESLNNGYYKITSVLNPEYSIDVYGGGTTMGNRVIQYHYHGGINQQWKIMENADGSISLMSRLAEESGTGYLLDVFGGGKTEGVNVIQWVSNNGDNQKWYLENVN